ncbi:MAG: hypothetical protein R3F59_13325 [Myxococcota bacterium]
MARSLPAVRSVVPLPSRSWAGRDAAAGALAGALGVPVADVLRWREPPEARQGELSNNDQRLANVEGRMTAQGGPPAGPVLLLDDYTGSGATLREAARVRRKELGHEGAVEPLTVAGALAARAPRAGVILEVVVHLEPDRDAIIAVIRQGLQGPVDMLNLLRFREVADYATTPALAPAASVSGAAAYDRYAAHTAPFLAAAGGEVLYAGTGAAPSSARATSGGTG